MPSTGEQPPSARPPALSRRQVLGALVGLPLVLTVAGCTGSQAGPEPSGSAPGATGSPGSQGAPTTTPPPPPPDLPALTEASVAARGLLATYEATASAHPTLAPVLAPYAADHSAHLDALGPWVAGPTPSSSVTATSTGAGTAGPTVPADPAAARAALVQAEKVAGDAATASARTARDGEAARLLASIGASRAVHAMLLQAPA
jgi:hypothetical protein